MDEGLRIHRMRFVGIVFDHSRMEARATQLANVGSARLVSMDRWIRHVSQDRVLQVRTVLEELGKEQGHRIHLDIFRVIVHVGRLSTIKVGYC